ncbi:MAG: Uma2 family endonuclease [Candidatus Kariarchaeaceae archaeon]
MNLCKLIHFVISQFLVIIVAPPPTIQHQRVIMFISNQLANFLSDSILEVFSSPIGLRLANDDILEPDIVVIDPNNAYTNNYIVKAPLLVIEVLSPSTKHRDLGVKKHKYEEFGVKEYWIIEPNSLKAEVFDLVEGKYILREELLLSEKSLTSSSLGFTLNKWLN